MTFLLKCIKCSDKFKVSAFDLPHKLYCDKCLKEMIDNYNKERRKVEVKI